MSLLSLKHLFVAALAAGLMAGLFCQAASGDTFYGWYLKKSLPDGFRWYGYKDVSKSDGHPVRAGDESMRFEIRAGDCSQKDCYTDRERHELKSEQTWTSGEEWYAWSIYLPEDYPIIFPVKTALAQFHQQNSHVVWMFQNKDGGYFVDNQVYGDTMHLRPVLTDDQMRGKWNDILVHANWTHDKGAGFFRVYVNGDTKPRYSWTGATKEKGTEIYFKIGIYRTFVSRRPGDEPTQVVYYDEVYRGSRCSRVTKFFDCDALEAR